MFRKIQNKIIFLMTIVVLVMASGLVLLKRDNRGKIALLLANQRNEEIVLINKMIELKSKSQSNFVYDCTFWDEMVDFVRTGDRNWADHNIDQSIASYNCDMAWVYKKDLSILYSANVRGFTDLGELPFSTETLHRIVFTENFYHFFISSTHGLFEVFGASIHPTNDENRLTEPQGYFFVGTLWSREYLEDISAFSGFSISLAPPGHEPPDPAEIDLRASVIRISHALYGWDGSPVSHLLSISTIPIAQVLQRQMNRQFWLTIFYGVVILLILVFILFQWINQPLGLLSKSLSDGNPDVLSGLASQKDEFGRLAVMIRKFFDQKKQVMDEIEVRKKTEETLRLSEEKYRTLFEEARDGIVIADAENGTILDCNRAAALLVERETADLVGQPQTMLHPPEEIKGDFSRTFDEHVHQKEGQVLETKVMTRQGKRIDVAIKANVFELNGQKIVQGLFRDMTLIKSAERKLRESLKEKEVLIKEIHHRVKNNMQVISSLFNLQSRVVQDEKALEVFRECQARIKSMALIHEKLYQSNDLANVDFAEYIRNLLTYLYQSYGNHAGTIQLDVQVGEARLGIDTAIPCGLILNELVSNCLKHAFPGREKGLIRVSLHQENGRTFLSVLDDGVGFPDGIDFTKSGSLGLQLVNTLVQQLEGTIALQRHTNGTEFRIVFSE